MTLNWCVFMDSVNRLTLSFFIDNVVAWFLFITAYEANIVHVSGTQTMTKPLEHVTLRGSRRTAVVTMMAHIHPRQKKIP